MPFLRCFTALAVLLVAVSTMTFTQPGRLQKNNPPRQQQGKPPQPASTPRPTPAVTRKAETFTQKLLRFLGLTVTPGALKGEEEDKLTGDVWLTDLQTGSPRRLTFTGGYRSPLALPGEQAIWALKGETIVEIPVAGGKPQERFSIPGIIKLAGVDETGRQIVLLREDGARRTVVELLALADGKRTALAYDADADTRMLAYLQGWERSYDGGRLRLYTQSGSQNEQRNVYLEEAGRAAVNISHCDDSPCGQPALALKARSVIFIKGQPRQ